MVDEKKIVHVKKGESIKQEQIQDSFGKALGLAEEGSETLEWVPAYYCEMFVLKSDHAKNFVNYINEELYKKRRIRKDKFLEYKTTPVRYSLADIRGGTLRNRMQKLLKECGFECRLPNNHVRFGGKKITDEDTGDTIHTLGCLGKIIAEKVPRVMYYFLKKTTIKYILVREHEHALFVRDGKILAVLKAGKHDIVNRSMEFDIIDIFYIDVGNITTRWGTNTMLTDGKGTMTATQVRLRINGSLVVRVNNVNNFITNIVKNKTEYYEGDLELYVKDKVVQTVNSEMSQAEPISVYQDAEKVMLAVKVKSNEFFQDMGIEIVDLSVGSCKFDAEVEQMFKDRLQKIKVEGATADSDTARKLQELQKLQELGIDINTYVQQEQKIKMAAAGGVSEEEKIKKEIKELEEKMEELDDSLDSGKISENIWEKRTDRLQKKIDDLKSKL